MVTKMMGFTAQNKLKIATLLFSILVLIFLTNLQERSMIKRLNEAVTSIYEDRVVVGNYILSLSSDMDKIIHLLETRNENLLLKTNSILADIDSLNLLYDKTYLTETEKVNFVQFKELCIKIKQYINSNNIEDAFSNSLKAHKTLSILSSIQVKEGKNKMDEVLSMTNTRNLLSYLEIVIIIVISILIQKIILSTKPLITKNKTENHNLN